MHTRSQNGGEEKQNGSSQSQRENDVGKSVEGGTDSTEAKQKGPSQGQLGKSGSEPAEVTKMVGNVEGGADTQTRDEKKAKGVSKGPKGEANGEVGVPTDSKGASEKSEKGGKKGKGKKSPKQDDLEEKQIECGQCQQWYWITVSRKRSEELEKGTFACVACMARGDVARVERQVEELRADFGTMMKLIEGFAVVPKAVPAGGDSASRVSSGTLAEQTTGSADATDAPVDVESLLSQCTLGALVGQQESSADTTEAVSSKQSQRLESNVGAALRLAEGLFAVARELLAGQGDGKTEEPEKRKGGNVRGQQKGKSGAESHGAQGAWQKKRNWGEVATSSRSGQLTGAKNGLAEWSGPERKCYGAERKGQEAERKGQGVERKSQEADQRGQGVERGSQRVEWRGQGPERERRNQGPERSGQRAERRGQGPVRSGQAAERRGYGAGRKGQGAAWNGQGTEQKGQRGERIVQGAERKGQEAERRGQGANTEGLLSRRHWYDEEEGGWNRVREAAERHEAAVANTQFRRERYEERRLAPAGSRSPKASQGQPPRQEGSVPVVTERKRATVKATVVERRVNDAQPQSESSVDVAVKVGAGKAKDEVLIVGDSQVRYLGPRVASEGFESVCLVNAGYKTGDLARELEHILEGPGTGRSGNSFTLSPTVALVQAGTNDVAQAVTQNKPIPKLDIVFNLVTVGNQLKQTYDGCRVSLSPIPYPGWVQDSRKNFKIRKEVDTLNVRLRKAAAANGLLFAETGWSAVSRGYVSRPVHAGDGLHLNRVGKEMLAKSFLALIA